MRMIIFRHGAAVDIGEKNVLEDSERMLSDEGRKKTRQAAKGVRAIGVLPDVILSSPLIRARETAHILANVYENKIKVKETPLLEPSTPISEVLARLNDMTEESVTLVGHNPHLSDLVADAVSGGALSILLKKASLCSVHFEGPARKGFGILELLVQPRQLRYLGTSKGSVF